MLPKTLIGIGLTIVLVVAVFVLGQGFMFQVGVSGWLQNNLSVTATVSGITSNYSQHFLRVENLELAVAEKTGRKTVARFLLDGKYDHASLFSRPLHFTELKLQVTELSVIRGKDGKINLEGLKPKLKTDLVIDQLSLSIDQIKYQNLNATQTEVKTIPVNIKDETFQNITGSEMLLEIIKKRVIARAGLNIVHSDAVTSSKSAGNSVKKAASNVSNFFKKAFRKKE